MLIVLIIIMIYCGLFIYNNLSKNKQINDSKDSYGYIPLGDSYTIGLWVLKSHRWPNIMVENFAKEGIKINILENPAISGNTVRDVINYQLPVLETYKPDFVTLFIGINDTFFQTDVGVFEHNYKELLDRIQKLLLKPKNIVLITIPDYSKFPVFKNSHRVSSSKYISSYNEVIVKESIERGLVLADIYPLSQEMTDEDDFVFDGFHPSRKGYIKWEKIIYPKVKELLLK